MQVPSGAGKEDEVGKMTDVSAIVPLLQAIFAILLVSGKTLRTVAANCETVSTKSAQPSPVGVGLFKYSGTRYSQGRYLAFENTRKHLI